MHSDAMSLREPRSDSTTAAYDIGAFVVKYQRLVELLFPVEITWNTTLYILRWENYFLTLLVLAAVSCLFYFPVIFFCLLVIVALILMAVGRYYGQSRQVFLLKYKEPPKASVLHQDQQNMRQYYKEQKNSHKQLMEYKKILENAEFYISKAVKSIEYLYSVVLWQSPEVSLCISVLLCIFLVLLFTVSLRSILAAIPVVALCSNRHFLNRTVGLWKKSCRFVYSKVKLKEKEKEITEPLEEVEVPLSNSSELGETRDRTSSSSVQIQDHSTESVPASSTASSDSEDTGRPQQQLRSRSSSQAVQPGNSSDGAEGSRGSPKPLALNVKVKGFCVKCNASFAKLLKRKHDCNYCGQTYCGSCTVKVKKTLLGATSPAAFEESVRVCMDCKLMLDTFNKNIHSS